MEKYRCGIMVWRDLKVVGTILELSKLLRSFANVSNAHETS